MEIARVISLRQNKIWEYWITNFPFRLCFRPRPLCSPNQRVETVSVKSVSDSLISKFSWHQKTISRESQKQMREMIPLFLTPCSVTKSAGFSSHTEVVVQLYCKGKAKVSNFLTSASSFTFNFFRTIKIMTFRTI